MQRRNKRLPNLPSPRSPPLSRTPLPRLPPRNPLLKSRCSRNRLPVTRKLKHHRPRL